MKAKNFIDIHFSYNGNLGVLQQRTIDNKIFCNQLVNNGLINADEYRAAIEEISLYFIKELNRIIENPVPYISAI